MHTLICLSVIHCIPESALHILIYLAFMNSFFHPEFYNYE